MEAVEVAPAGAALPPLLFSRRRRRHGPGPLGGRPAVLVSGVGQVGREGEHGGNSTTGVVIIVTGCFRQPMVHGNTPSGAQSSLLRRRMRRSRRLRPPPMPVSDITWGPIELRKSSAS